MTDLLMQRGATYSDDESLRWTLTRSWAPGPRACFIGHNPSTAGHETDDRTSLAWVALATANGCGSYVAVNFYPFRSADPAACRRWADWQNNGPDYAVRDALWVNIDVVVREAKAADVVVACWGNLARDPLWADHVIEAIQTGEEPWPNLYCIGFTSDGSPKHPMARGRHRVPRDQEFMLWRRVTG
jgi:hypothetical protein